MTKDEYHDYLKSPQWQKVRQHAWRQAFGRCETCYKDVGQRFHVHHKTYQFVGQELVAPETIACLCPECHAAEHGK